ncbi:MULTISPECIES: EAL domain-containing protein [unclassified Devosia]|uniref:EAL domain-containing protein n=1 Tax=unclassified Devosia TaxID=196773 RepID=UPI001557FB41
MQAASVKFMQRALAVIVCCLVVATCYTSLVIAQRQTALQNLSRYNVAWTVSQSLSEFTRLEQSLALYALDATPERLAEAMLRLDIMFSRVEMYEAGPASSENSRTLRIFIEADPANQETVHAVRGALETVDGLLASEPHTRAKLLEGLAALAPLDARLTALASAAGAYGAARTAADRAELQRLHWIFTGLAWGLILCGVALTLLLFRNNRLLQRAYQDVSTLAAQLGATSKTLRAQNDRFDAALNNMSHAICTFDADGKLVVFNQRFAELCGLPQNLEPGLTATQMEERAAEQGADTAYYSILARQLPMIWNRTGKVFTSELPDGRAYAVSHTPLPDGGWLATYEDISERRRAELRIAHMAHHDALTNLPNRVQFRLQLDQMLLRSRKHDLSFCVFLLDLDGFKDVNDTFGHHLGDQLLKVVAQRLQQGSTTYHAVARLGGDEFATACWIEGDAEQQRRIGERLIADLSRPYFLEGRELSVGASIGVAQFCPKTPVETEELLRHADLALYVAKADGKGRVRFFEPELDQQLQTRKTLEADLRKALDRGEMEVHYQPVLVAETRQVCRYEALLRWRPGGDRLVPPSTFIPLAEATGLINEIGAWVLQQACAEAACWPGDMGLAVNLSAVQFKSGELVRTIGDALAASGLDAHRLELEITESVLLQGDEQTLSALMRLKDIGVRIAMDDFGTGYSSLSNLRRFPFDTIKIDKSFVADLTNRDDAVSVVRLIIQLGEVLGMQTTAEGVETEEQFHLLQQAGCTNVQGFLFDRAKPASEIAHHIAAAHAPPAKVDSAADPLAERKSA